MSLDVAATAKRVGILPIQLRWITTGEITPSADLAERLKVEGIATPGKRNAVPTAEPGAPWTCEFFEQVYELAESVGADPHGIARILDRTAAATAELAEMLEARTRIPKKEWMFPGMSSYRAAFIRPAPEWDDFMPKPVLTSPLAVRLWGVPAQFRAYAYDADMVPILLARVVYRRLGVRSKERAEKLEKATGVPAMDWLTNRTSKHPAFIGKPARSL